MIIKNNVVTGCAGFIGSHLTEALNARHEHVLGYDNLERGQVGIENLGYIKHNVSWKLLCQPNNLGYKNYNIEYGA